MTEFLNVSVKTFSLLLPSHNCIIIHNVQFSRCIFESFKDSVKHLSDFMISHVFLSSASINPCGIDVSGLLPVRIYIKRLVEISGIEPLTSCLQGRRSPS